MPLETILAIFGFAFVTSISPGPGNFLLLTSGVNFGFVRSVPLILGISFGFLSMVFLVGLGFGQILKSFPFLYSALKYCCFAYVLWLAWKIGTSKSLGNDANSPTTTKGFDDPINFVQAALLQLLNPKAWTVSLIITVSYTSPTNYTNSLILLVLFFAIVNLPSISIWALSGTFLRRTLIQGNRIAIFNRFMALLLIGSMIPMVIAA
ncbi:lysine transporter LysE [Kiloniella spongiae]|uniref:Lysine transporter LysE n=1 Tax=Kiloniella spongiae TaxID=1489064 RepID=A0A0H2MLL1_9PROT|nr:LysE family translocator [Kiloniella spongiae]KLN61627.1 lysine transporter LysE [Kiloniella spongiae]